MNGEPRANRGGGDERGDDLRLAFDLSTPHGSVALAIGSGLLGGRELSDPKAQAARLVPAIAELLEEAGRSPGEIRRIVVGRGPGSFTGVRIAAATARGLAAGVGARVWTISSLAAGAVAAGAGADAGAVRYVLFDAGGDRLYAAAYRIGEGAGPGGRATPGRRGDLIEVLLPPCATTVGELLRGELTGGEFHPGAVFCGDGALAHASAIESGGHRVLGFPAGVPGAEALLRVHALDSDAPPEPPGSRWEPEYLRGSSARPMGAAVALPGTRDG